MIIIALTGSIASGKSTVVAWLKELGLAVDDADAHVHDIFSKDLSVIDAVGKLWPECVVERHVDRSCLRKHVIGDENALRLLEKITHPAVWKRTQAFIETSKASGKEAVFLDIPLLFETQSSTLYDCTLLVYCSPENQRTRALERGTPAEVFDYLSQQQVPLSEKLAKADFKLNTDGTLAQTRRKLLEVIHQIESKYQIQLIKG